jgi:hypothetical protein
MKILAFLMMLLFLLFSCGRKQNVLNQDDVYLVDSIGTNKSCFHRNMNLVEASYYPVIINSIKSGIDSVNNYKSRQCRVQGSGVPGEDNPTDWNERSRSQ